MAGPILEAIGHVVFYLLVEVVFIGTGEILLFLLSLGKRKPVWKRDCQGGAARLGILIDVSCILGFLFWLGLAWLLIGRLS